MHEIEPSDSIKANLLFDFVRDDALLNGDVFRALSNDGKSLAIVLGDKRLFDRILELAFGSLHAEKAARALVRALGCYKIKPCLPHTKGLLHACLSISPSLMHKAPSIAELLELVTACFQFFSPTTEIFIFESLHVVQFFTNRFRSAVDKLVLKVVSTTSNPRHVTLLCCRHMYDASVYAVCNNHMNDLDKNIRITLESALVTERNLRARLHRIEFSNSVTRLTILEPPAITDLCITLTSPTLTQFGKDLSQIVFGDASHHSVSINVHSVEEAKKELDRHLASPCHQLDLLYASHGFGTRSGFALTFDGPRLECWPFIEFIEYLVSKNIHAINLYIASCYAVFADTVVAQWNCLKLAPPIQLWNSGVECGIASFTDSGVEVVPATVQQGCDFVMSVFREHFNAGGERRPGNMTYAFGELYKEACQEPPGKLLPFVDLLQFARDHEGLYTLAIAVGAVSNDSADADVNSAANTDSITLGNHQSMEGTDPLDNRHRWRRQVARFSGSDLFGVMREFARGLVGRNECSPSYVVEPFTGDGRAGRQKTLLAHYHPDSMTVLESRVVPRIVDKNGQTKDKEPFERCRFVLEYDVVVKTAVLWYTDVHYGNDFDAFFWDDNDDDDHGGGKEKATKTKRSKNKKKNQANTDKDQGNAAKNEAAVRAFSYAANQKIHPFQRVCEFEVAWTADDCVTLIPTRNPILDKEMDDDVRSSSSSSTKKAV